MTTKKIIFATPDTTAELYLDGSGIHEKIPTTQTLIVGNTYQFKLLDINGNSVLQTSISIGDDGVTCLSVNGSADLCSKLTPPGVNINFDWIVNMYPVIDESVHDVVFTIPSGAVLKML